MIDGEDDEIQLTYAELDRQARSIAALLQQAGNAGERALLLYPPGIEYITAFFGCLYAGWIAVPAYPPNPAHIKRSLPRLHAITTTARPAVALTTAKIAARSRSALRDDVHFGSIQWLATDRLDTSMAETWQERLIEPSSLAFLQYTYTSGSTATPKGVKLTHANLLHNSKLIQHEFGHSSESQGVIWLPPYHNMSLIGGIIQPLYAGFPVTLMAPVDFLQRPLRWLQAISRYRATTSGGPNFAYDLCVQKITAEQRATLDLTSWTVAFNGAEPVRAATLERFATVFAECGLGAGSGTISHRQPPYVSFQDRQAKPLRCCTPGSACR